MQTKPKIQIDLAEVERLASLGLSQEQIADSLGISNTTFYARKRESEEFAQAVKRGKASGVAAVASKLLKKIEEMDTTAIIFFLKTQGGWAEKKISDVNLSANGSAPEGLLSIYKRMKEDA
jgi:predicted transcriptional regulator